MNWSFLSLSWWPCICFVCVYVLCVSQAVTANVFVIHCCVTNHPQNLAAKKVLCLLSLGFCGSGIQAWLSWGPVPQDLQQAAITVSFGATVNSRLSLGKIYLQAHPCASGKIQFLVGCWPETAPPVPCHDRALLTRWRLASQTRLQERARRVVRKMDATVSL